MLTRSGRTGHSQKGCWIRCNRRRRKYLLRRHLASPFLLPSSGGRRPPSLWNDLVHELDRRVFLAPQRSHVDRELIGPERYPRDIRSRIAERRDEDRSGRRVYTWKLNDDRPTILGYGRSSGRIASVANSIPIGVGLGGICNSWAIVTARAERARLTRITHSVKITVDLMP